MSGSGSTWLKKGKAGRKLMTLLPPQVCHGAHVFAGFPHGGT